MNAPIHTRADTVQSHKFGGKREIPERPQVTIDAYFSAENAYSSRRILRRRVPLQEILHSRNTLLTFDKVSRIIFPEETSEQPLL